MAFGDSECDPGHQAAGHQTGVATRGGRHRDLPPERKRRVHFTLVMVAKHGPASLEPLH
eukprot:CAMPEP_0172643066 /NCGR_PEP_ID=MMETSP1068-20121228/235107_1 /TAXON_ID=35684 /ORGANISM="Pseudopedinella elastica, Strain CCMP716" /LENGTH=58 /DNA_ID=CAMNT_0013457023 /DNA_START=150 /DNA_END=323 /DNA_ORIENTATION=-